MSVVYIGLDRFLGHIEKWIHLLDHAHKVLESIADDVVEDAKHYCPVRTGALRDSIRKEVTAEAVNVVAGGGAVDYAGYVEYGTSKMPAQPYLRPAVMQHELDILTQLERLIL